MRERRRLRQHGREIGVAGGELFGDDAAGEVVGAGAARLFRERQRAQSDLRGFVQRLYQDGTRARLQPLRRERERPDLLRDEIANGVADLQLLRAQMKAVHHSPLMPAVLITPAHLSRSLRMSAPSSSGPSG